MSKINFTDENILELSKNIYIKNISNKSITYTNEFKIHFITEYNNGKTPKQIFNESGFDIDIIGTKRIEYASSRWRKASEERKVINRKLPSYKIFNLIEFIINKFNLRGMVRYLCTIAGVSKSGYYSYKSNINTRENQDLKAKEIILKSYKFRGYSKGSRSIKMTFKNEFNIIYSRKKIQWIMRKYGIICPIHKANPYRRMAKATKEHRVVANKLNREFNQYIP